MGDREDRAEPQRSRLGEPRRSSTDEPLEILDRRLAGGEIDVETYEQLRSKLSSRLAGGNGVIAMRTQETRDRRRRGGGVAAVGAVVALAAGGGGSWTPGWGMMGGRYAYRPAQPTQVHTLADARSDAQQFADRLGLRVDEVMQFERNFYAKLVDSSGNGATEVLVDPSTGVVSIEYGPAMMWNTRYGIGRSAGSMMGSYGRGMMRGAGSGAMMGAGRVRRLDGWPRARHDGRLGQRAGDDGRLRRSRQPAPPPRPRRRPFRSRTLTRWRSAGLTSNEPGVKVETRRGRVPGLLHARDAQGRKDHRHDLGQCLDRRGLAALVAWSVHREVVIGDH